MPDHHTTTTGPKVHELKCWPPHFEEVLTGCKPFELRRNDRSFEVGDLLELREYDNTVLGEYTGRSCRRRVTCVLGDGDYGMEPGHVALGLAEQDHPAPPLGRDDSERLEEIAGRILGDESALRKGQDEIDACFLRDLAKNLGDGGLEGLKRLVDRQAGDEGLWFEARNANTAYIQQELRELHQAIEVAAELSTQARSDQCRLQTTPQARAAK